MHTYTFRLGDRFVRIHLQSNITQNGEIRFISVARLVTCHWHRVDHPFIVRFVAQVSVSVRFGRF